MKIGETGKCEFCEDPFVARNSKQRFCSRDCQMRYQRQVVHDRRVAEREAAEAAAVTQ